MTYLLTTPTSAHQHFVWYFKTFQLQIVCQPNASCLLYSKAPKGMQLQIFSGWWNKASWQLTISIDKAHSTETELCSSVCVWKHFELFKFLMNQKCFHTLAHLFFSSKHPILHTCVWICAVCFSACNMFCFVRVYSHLLQKSVNSNSSTQQFSPWLWLAQDPTKCNWT